MLAYTDEGAGPPILFLHGVGSTRSRWTPIVDLLRDDFRCVAVDLPGFGDSPLGETEALNPDRRRP